MSIISPTPVRIDVSREFIGPATPPAKPKRDTYAFRLNETASLIDQVNNKTVKCHSQAELNSFKQAAAFIDTYRPMIDQHIERRVANFLNQLVVCYQTKLHFEMSYTADQGDNAKPIKLILGRSSELVKREAAHSSTLPALNAYDLNAWNTYKKNGGVKPPSYVYVKGSECYRNNNATMEMPKAINDADGELDEFLRPFALDLLNQASNGEISPQKGVKLFVKEAIRISNDTWYTQADAGVQKALEIFWDKLKDVDDSLKDPENFNRLISLKITGDQPERLSQIAYKIRFKSIRDHQLSESQFHTEIKTVSDRVNSAMKSTGSALHFFDDAFRDIILCNLNSQDTVRMKKFWNHTPTQFQSETERKNYMATVDYIVDNHSPAILTLVSLLSQLMANMRANKIEMRGAITLAIRGALNWSQRDLSGRINTLYPHLPSSQPTISRIENNIKLIDFDYATKLSQVFKVDPCLFMPDTFNE